MVHSSYHIQTNVSVTSGSIVGISMKCIHKRGGVFFKVEVGVQKEVLKIKVDFLSVDMCCIVESI